MGLFIFRFWPVLLPILCYWIWHRLVSRRAVKRGQTPPDFRDGPLYWVLIATLATAACCFFVLGAVIDDRKGVYVPPHLENGVMVPGAIVEEEKGQ